MWTEAPGSRPQLAVPCRLRAVGVTPATWGRSPGDTASAPSDLPRPARTRNSSYLWRAVDQHGVVLDILVQDRRNATAARRFFKRLLAGLKYKPRRLVTDG